MLGSSNILRFTYITTDRKSSRDNVVTYYPATQDIAKALRLNIHDRIARVTQDLNPGWRERGIPTHLRLAV